MVLYQPTRKQNYKTTKVPVWGIERGGECFGCSQRKSQLGYWEGGEEGYENRIFKGGPFTFGIWGYYKNDEGVKTFEDSAKSLELGQYFGRLRLRIYGIAERTRGQ